MNPPDIAHNNGEICQEKPSTNQSRSKTFIAIIVNSILDFWHKEKGPKTTFLRVCTSEHLQDLQWIAGAALLTEYLCLICVISFEWTLNTPPGRLLQSTSSAAANIAFVYTMVAALSSLYFRRWPYKLSFFLLAVFSYFPVQRAAHFFLEHSRSDLAVGFRETLSGKFDLLSGITAAVALVVSWSYQTASSRLGAVDLFSCEISAICRACLVARFAQTSIADCPDFRTSWEQTTRSSTPSRTRSIVRSVYGSVSKVIGHNHADISLQTEPAQPQAKPFTVQENYTPVHDGNLSDLKPLDADVVTWVTEFYTYRKAMMDYRRLLASEGLNAVYRLQLYRKMIYMQYLMYESGRKAIERLIEYEPNGAESQMNIYCSELVVYAWLRDTYKFLRDKGQDDEPHEGAFLSERLNLRLKSYRIEVENLINKVRKKQNLDVNWCRAYATINELQRCYVHLFPEKKVATAPIRISVVSA